MRLHRCFEWMAMLCLAVGLFHNTLKIDPTYNLLFATFAMAAASYYRQGDR